MQKINQKAKIKNQKGIALVLTLVVLAVAFAIVLSLAAIFLTELQASNLAVDSTKSFYAADAGVERGLFLQRKQANFSDQSGTLSPNQTWSYQTQCRPNFCQVGGTNFDCREIRVTGQSGSTQRALTTRYVVPGCP